MTYVNSYQKEAHSLMGGKHKNIRALVAQWIKALACGARDVGSSPTECTKELYEKFGAN